MTTLKIETIAYKKVRECPALSKFKTKKHPRSFIEVSENEKSYMQDVVATLALPKKPENKKHLALSSSSTTTTL